MLYSPISALCCSLPGQYTFISLYPVFVTSCRELSTCSLQCVARGLFLLLPKHFGFAGLFSSWNIRSQYVCRSLRASHMCVIAKLTHTVSSTAQYCCLLYFVLQKSSSSPFSFLWLFFVSIWTLNIYFTTEKGTDSAICFPLECGGTFRMRKLLLLKGCTEVKELNTNHLA